MGKAVYVVGTFDTKAEELLYVAQLLRDASLDVITVDASTRTSRAQPDVPPEEVARYHPDGKAAVLGLPDRGRAVDAMSLALSRFIVGRDDLAGIIGLGGSGGTTIATAAMRALPIGIPKVMVSTIASGNVSGYVGISDITMMFPVTDIAGLNKLSRTILANGANALAGMVSGTIPEVADARPSIGISMFGVTTPCVQQLTDLLDARYDCQVFHANGSGGQAFEALIDARMLTAMIDVTTTEAADYLMGGVCSAGPYRFEAMTRTGVPWIGSCGALDMVNFGARDTVPAQYAERLLYVHNANVTLMRTTADENRQIAEWLAAKLNKASGPVHLVLPEKGVSMLDQEGQPFWNPEADAALFDTLERCIVQTGQRKIYRVPYHINDAEFAAMVDNLVREVVPAQ